MSIRAVRAVSRIGGQESHPESEFSGGSAKYLWNLVCKGTVNIANHL